jgi:ribosomal protein L11 methylase PrmA
LLVSHTEILSKTRPREAYLIIKPKQIPFISYPYGWSFSQLKAAALLTLKVQMTALEYNMILKDASAYNVQFFGTKPIFVDTLSFEKYTNGVPWIGYKQFCQHFLAPLALMAYTDLRLSLLSRIFLDGIPLDLTSKLLPIKTMLNFGLIAHIHLHSKAQTFFADKSPKTTKLKTSKRLLIYLLKNLESSVQNLRLKKTDTEWAKYYSFTNYSKKSFDNKKSLVEKYLMQIKPKTVWDLGGNTGEFSRIASKIAHYVVSFDKDPMAVEKNYLEGLKNGETNVLPLVIDLTNPSPSIGWANEERASLVDRGPADTVLALALIHHLAISNNLPFEKIAKFLRSICKKLIIEFIPKNDSNVQRLLSTRKDIFTKYNQSSFEAAFKKFFKIVRSENIIGSKRILYLMKRQ